MHRDILNGGDSVKYRVYFEPFDRKEKSLTFTCLHVLRSQEPTVSDMIENIAKKLKPDKGS